MLPVILFALSIVLIGAFYLRGSRRKSLGAPGEYEKWLRKNAAGGKRPRSRGGPDSLRRSAISGERDGLGRH